MQIYFFVVLISFCFLAERSLAEVSEKASEAKDSAAVDSPAADSGKETNKKNEGSATEEAKSAVENPSYTGEIFVIRNSPKTEVFFRNHNQSYIIPKGNKHNTLLKELQKKSKLNQPATVEFNAKTREITQVKEPATSAKETEGSASSGSAGSSKENSK